MAVVGPGRVARLGNGTSGRAWLFDGVDARTPTAVGFMRPGFASVAQMLSTPGATWAHRGGSVSWAEHTLFAYTQAVARGYGCLEVSLSRTRDGVWFALHDATLNRTSGLPASPAVDPTTMTWAELDASYKVTVGVGAPRPYMRWDELVAAYGGSHVIVVDPKHQITQGGARLAEFLDMVKRDLGTDRAIIKFSGVGSGAVWLAGLAADRGFQTWGYFYQTDWSSGDLATYQGPWSILGMDYTASQQAWDAVRSYGKPVVAHIVPDQAGYATALAKGADMVQVSGVGAVAAVSWQ